MTDWVTVEPGLLGALQELVRLVRRARARAARVALIALGLTVLVVAQRAQKPRIFGASVVYRVVEGDLEVATAPRPARQLRQYVYDVAFSGAALSRVIRALDLYPLQRARDPELAVESMRGDLEVEVWRNYFLEERGVFDPARTARISIAFHDQDPERALVVARALGKLLETSTEETRTAQAEDAANRSADYLSRTNEKIGHLESMLAQTQLALLRAGPPGAVQLRNDVINLRAELESLYALQRTLSGQKTATALRVAIEASQLGLRFEMIDGGHAEVPRLSRPSQLLLLGGATFLVLLLLVGLAVGALDQRVRDLDDVQRLGLVGVGHVAGFPGDDVGTLEARLTNDYTRRS